MNFCSRIQSVWHKGTTTTLFLWILHYQQEENVSNKWSRANLHYKWGHSRIFNCAVDKAISLSMYLKFHSAPKTLNPNHNLLDRNLSGWVPLGTMIFCFVFKTPCIVLAFYSALNYFLKCSLAWYVNEAKWSRVFLCCAGAAEFLVKFFNWLFPCIIYCFTKHVTCVSFVVRLKWTHS